MSEAGTADRTRIDARGLAEGSELVDFALALATSPDPGRIASLVAGRVAGATGAAFAAVYLADPDGVLRLGAASGDVPDAGLEKPPAVVEEAAAGGVTVAERVAAVPIASLEGRFGVVLLGGLAEDDGEVLSFVASVAGLAAASLASARRLRASAAEARRDALTGLGNSRAFNEHLDRLLAEASDSGSEVALVLFDLDDFKQINDREGHLVGDSVLRDVARRALGTLRAGEEVFRMGGEEFAVVVEGGRDSGKRVGERVRKAIAGKRRGHGLPSISAGAAAFPCDADGKESLIHRADLALYAAKERGKNQVVSYHERLDAETVATHADGHRTREEEWWQKVLGITTVRRSLADELGPGCRPQEVAVLAEAVGERLGCSQDELRAIVLAAFLTELSKLRLPASIRGKRGPLNERDWAVVRENAALAADSLAPLSSLRDVLEIVRGCRERFDGSGYPQGLVGAQTALGARIVAVSEAFCAMTSGRSYRPARTRARALLELGEQAGTHFDPGCVRALLDVVGGLDRGLGEALSVGVRRY